MRRRAREREAAALAEVRRPRHVLGRIISRCIISNLLLVLAAVVLEADRECGTTNASDDATDEATAANSIVGIALLRRAFVVVMVASAQLVVLCSRNQLQKSRNGWLGASDVKGSNI